MQMSQPGGQPLKIAFITTGLYLDPTQQQTQARYLSMSKFSTGDVFGVIYEQRFAGYQMGAYRVKALGLPSALGGYGVVKGTIRALGYTVFVLWSLLRARFSKARYDLIVAIDPFKSGTLALIGSKLLGVPFVVEFNGNYFAALDLEDGGSRSWFSSLKARIARGLIPRVARAARSIKLLYEAQLGPIATPAISAKARVFHNPVPLDAFRSEPSDERYILLLGHPWYLKGADLLIAAFQQISERHPHWHLRIVGYCPNPAEFIAMANGNPRIHLDPAGVPHSQAIELINRCSVLVLASRTEGMGRVLLEAMAASKPVVGAKVDGIPRVIHHGSNGLLFQAGDADDLARQLDRLLSDPALAEELARNGRQDVQERLSVEAYEERYRALLFEAARPSHAMEGTN
jgi:glycosyltransferase involved in cell wall biosynthesis